MAERALATAFVNIVPGTKDLELWMKKGLPDDAEKAGDDAGKKLGGGMFSSFKGAMLGLGGIVAAAGVTNFVGDLLKSAEEGQKADAVLVNITKSMGLFDGEVDSVTQRLQEYATAQMNATGIDDDAIKSAQAKLMTFGAVASSADEMGGAFDRATKLTMDLSAAGFGSLDSASVMLGKALQDPVSGVTALQRVGVALSDSQKKQIEDFMAVGDAASAQNIILSEVERQVGGTAAASATASDKFKAGWDDALQSIGTAILPIATGVAAAMTTYIVPAVTGVSDGIKWMTDNANLSVPILAGLGVVLLSVLAPSIWAAVTAVWAFTVALLANPLTWIVIGIGLLIAGIVALAMNWDVVVKWISDVWGGFIGWITDGINAFASWWNGIWDAIGSFFSDLWNGFLYNVTVAWMNIQRWVLEAVLKFQAWWNGIWEKVGTGFSDMWNGLIDGVKGAFGTVVTFIKGIINNVIDLVNSGIDGINGIGDAIRNATGGAVDISIGKIPHLAKGGYVDRPTTALIGEAGPEVVTPLKDFERMMGLNGDAKPQTQVFQITSLATDPVAAGQDFARRMRFGV